MSKKPTNRVNLFVGFSFESAGLIMVNQLFQALHL